MSEYYIKVVDAPGLDNMDSNNEVFVEFRTPEYASKFSNCAGFVLYETGANYGSKCVFAKGHIKIPSKIRSSDCSSREKIFPFEAETIIEKSIIPHSNGIPLCELKKICPGPVFRKMQTVGGLFQITKSEFDALCVELDKRG